MQIHIKIQSPTTGTQQQPKTVSNIRFKSGFTLLELSIVLVIIALIIGGILVGQDMIKAAEVRATVGQVEKYNSAVNTFRTKYNGIPGDLPQASAAYFGFLTLSVTPPVGQGDGNGVIEGGATGITDPIGEPLVFWRHLSDANLVDGNFGLVGTSLIDPTTGLVTGPTVNSVNNNIPPAKINGSTSFIVYSAGGINYYQLMPIATITNAPAYTYGSAGVSPIQAYNMDIKLDDGQPNTGAVIARSLGGSGAGVNAIATFNQNSTNNNCMVGSVTVTTATDTATTYNRKQLTGGDDPSCSVRFRFN